MGKFKDFMKNLFKPKPHEIEAKRKGKCLRVMENANVISAIQARRSQNKRRKMERQVRG